MSRFFRRQGDSDSDSSSSEEEERLSEVSDEEAPAPAAPKKPMSRFLKTGSGSSSSDTSDEEMDDSDDSDASDKNKKKKSKFIRGEDSDEDSDDDAPRIVKSAKDRRQEEMQATGNAIANALKIEDWNAVNNNFDKLIRLVQRQTNLSDPVPSIFLEQLKSLENEITEAQNREKAATKKMNAGNARALNGVKQKLRKSAKEYEAAIKSFEEDPEKYRAEENKEPAAAPPTKAKKVRTGEEGEEEEDTFQTVGRKAMTFSTEALYKNLLAIQEARGKKNTDRNEQMHLLERILPHRRDSVWQDPCTTCTYLGAFRL
ncbi:hypothetical protein OPQ81_006058 [Rhizoctonia solani]|nr:hypothetical protein OPQ81_006058 [Rhizoctonia solani]